MIVNYYKTIVFYSLIYRKILTWKNLIKLYKIFLTKILETWWILLKVYQYKEIRFNPKHSFPIEIKNIFCVLVEKIMFGLQQRVRVMDKTEKREKIRNKKYKSGYCFKCNRWNDPKILHGDILKDHVTLLVDDSTDKSHNINIKTHFFYFDTHPLQIV